MANVAPQTTNRTGRRSSTGFLSLIKVTNCNGNHAVPPESPPKLTVKLPGSRRNSSQAPTRTQSKAATEADPHSTAGHTTPVAQVTEKQAETDPEDAGFAILQKGKGLQGSRMSIVATHFGATGPTRKANGKTRAKRIWSRKHQEAPPVPEIPSLLSFTLPFESEDGHRDSLPSSSSNDEKVTASATTAATPAAAVARKVTQQYAEKEQQLKDSGVVRAQALADARLTPAQLTEAVKLAGAEIKQRGLANVGILRPFRVGANTASVDRLAELFLLAVDPKQYEDSLSITGDPATQSASDIARATFGQPSAKKELLKQLAYANVHDVADFLKWAVRRLKVNRSDFDSASEFTWYSDFVAAEKAQAFPKSALTDLLLKQLPAPTGQLLTSLFELLTTVSAHYVANAMPASRICKTFGFWLFGRIGSDKPSQTLFTFAQDWKRASDIMEHLLLAFLRDQSAKLHFMPTRLTELIEGYPCIPQDSEFGAPGLINRATEANTALKVDLRSENVVVNSMRPRGPRETLAAALLAPLPDGESSAEADDWASLVATAKAAVKKVRAEAEQLNEESGAVPLDRSSLQTAREMALLKDEEARIFSIFAAEFAQRKKMLGLPEEDGIEESDSSAQPTSSTLSLAPEESEFGVMARPFSGASSTLPASGNGFSSLRVLTSRGYLSTLPEDRSPSLSPVTAQPTRANDEVKEELLPADSSDARDSGDGMDWSAFRSGGFASESSTNLGFDTFPWSEPRKSDTFSTASPPTASPKVRRETSLGTLRRKVGRGRSNKDQSWPAAPAARPAKPTFTITGATTIDLDEALVSLWQDQVLDANPATALPSIVCAQLNRDASMSLMSPANGGAKGSWLIIQETVVPPSPGGSSAPTTSGNGSVPRIRAIGNGAGGWSDASSFEGKRSLFSPSLKSFGASIRQKVSLKRLNILAVYGGRKQRSASEAPDVSDSEDAGEPSARSALDGSNARARSTSTVGAQSASTIKQSATTQAPRETSALQAASAGLAVPDTATSAKPGDDAAQASRTSPSSVSPNGTGSGSGSEAVGRMSSAASSRFFDADAGEEEAK